MNEVNCIAGAGAIDAIREKRSLHPVSVPSPKASCAVAGSKMLSIRIATTGKRRAVRSLKFFSAFLCLAGCATQPASTQPAGRAIFSCSSEAFTTVPSDRGKPLTGFFLDGPPPNFPRRTICDVMRAMDANQRVFQEIYDHARQVDSRLGAGLLVVDIDIEPDGRASRVSIVSTTFADPAFESAIVAQILALRFPPRNVPSYTAPHYPIRFSPNRVD